MFIAMNRFHVIKGSEAAFEQVWLSRDTHLHQVRASLSSTCSKAPKPRITRFMPPIQCGRIAPSSNMDQIRSVPGRASSSWREQAALFGHPQFEGFKVRQTVGLGKDKWRDRHHGLRQRIKLQPGRDRHCPKRPTSSLTACAARRSKSPSSTTAPAAGPTDSNSPCSCRPMALSDQSPFSAQPNPGGALLRHMKVEEIAEAIAKLAPDQLARFRRSFTAFEAGRANHAEELELPLRPNLAASPAARLLN